MFDLQQFRQIAPEWSGRLHYHPQLGSTNDEALSLASSVSSHLSVVLADHQLTGRGRRGAEWLSEPGAGLLFSLIIKPESEQSTWHRIALIAGLAVASALREHWSLEAEVKWPNDVLIEGKKCCGILVETNQNDVVVGIGINVTGSPASEDAVALNALTPYLGSREQLLLVILDELQQELEKNDFVSQVKRLHEICYLTNKMVTLKAAGKEHVGKVVGISDKGELILEISGKTVSFLQADTIRIVDFLS